MCLNNEQRIEIILLAGSGRGHMVANAFHIKHGTKTTHDTVAKLIGKLKKTGIVTYQARCGRRRSANDDGTATKILAAPIRSPTRSARRLSAESGINK